MNGILATIAEFRRDLKSARDRKVVDRLLARLDEYALECEESLPKVAEVGIWEKAA